MQGRLELLPTHGLEVLMRHHFFAAGTGMLLLLGACAANTGDTSGIAPSRRAAKSLEESKYYAPSEPADLATQPAAQPAAQEGPKAMPAAYVAPDQRGAAPAVEHVPVDDATSGQQARPIVPAFPARMEQARMRDMQTVYFRYDQAELTPAAKRELQANAAWLKTHSNVRVRVEGHCDERGTNEYNLALGARRANQVRDYLVQLGVSIGTLDPVSFGEEMPLKTGHDESAWRLNRRVEFSPAENPRPTAALVPGGSEPRM
jgi:peptidoglycan-associated lipoprotein